MSRAGRPSPRLWTTATKGETVDKGSIRADARRHKGRKARTNLGRYRSLERRYWNGGLSDEEAARFEQVVYALGTLYREARA